MIEVIEFTEAKTALHGTGSVGTGTKLVRVSHVFTRDLVGPVWIGSAIWYQMSPLMKVTPYGTVLVPCKQNGSVPQWIRSQMDLNISDPV